jgi:MscS family membrane protein
MVYIFFKVDNWSAELRERHNVYLEIMRLARDVGVQFAFPTQTLHVESLAAPGAERDLAQPLAEPKLAEVVRAFGPGGERARPVGPKIAGGYYATEAAAPKGGDE